MVLRYRRSAGVPVKGVTFRAIQRGNRARDRQDWRAAAIAYRAALATDPDLAHIWVQLGHALKENGDRPGAKAAYVHATELRPEDADPALHLGHLAKDAGDADTAARHYVEALRRDPADREILLHLHHVLGRTTAKVREPLLVVLRSLPMDDGAGADRPATPTADAGPVLVFDVSDLIQYFDNARLPTGIQRVQIQTIRHAFERKDRRHLLCCMPRKENYWVEIPPILFLHLAELSSTSGIRDDPDWMLARGRLHLCLLMNEPLAFPRDACLVNLGASWQLHNYFLAVRNAKACSSIRYITFVHDLIAVIRPDLFVPRLVREFTAWVAGLFDHADHFLVNSENTRRDLIAIAATLGRTLDPAAISVIRLDADFRTPGSAALPIEALARLELAAKPFVLMVGTLEPRKGHAVALEAWARLIRRHGQAAVPKLVFAGKRGWLSTRIFERLKDEVLSSRVVVLSGLSDAELALLYRSCLFTVYPSQYEGWGLPVTEALCYGKAVITSDVASLPEAGGSFALYSQANDPASLADSAERLIFDPGYRRGCEERISNGFRPRTWSDLSRQIEDELIQLTRRTDHPNPAPDPPLAKPGAIYSLAFGGVTQLRPDTVVSEAFRMGTGWFWPSPDGCSVGRRGAELVIGLPPGLGSLRVGLLLTGPESRDSDWLLEVQHGPTLRGAIRRSKQRWVTFVHPQLDDDEVLRLDIRGDYEEEDDDDSYAERDAIGVCAFFIHEIGDMNSQARILEAITLGDF